MTAGAVAVDGFDVVDGVLVAVVDGAVRPVPALWLREWTQDPAQLDLVSDQRTFDPHRLDPDLRYVEVRVARGIVRARFSDGHDETWDAGFLRAALAERGPLGTGCPDPRPWTSDLGRPPRHTWSQVSSDDRALEGALHDLLALGVVVVEGAPIAEGAVLDVAARFGHVRHTNFGTLFDVRSVPSSNDLAYRSIGLGAHTDNPYREPVPGIQLLHCLRNETCGGLSTLVDSLAVTDHLAATDPAALELLAQVVVRFTWRDATTALESHRPVVARDHRGRVTGLHYSPKLDHLPLMPDDATRAYQRARRQLAELLADDRFRICFPLDAGDVLVFSNDRVLHGRTAFDTAEGDRHLQGCYIDHDEPRSRYRVLRRGAPS